MRATGADGPAEVRGADAPVEATTTPLQSVSGNRVSRSERCGLS